MKVVVLDIRDRYRRGDPDLTRLLKEKLSQHLGQIWKWDQRNNSMRACWCEWSLRISSESVDSLSKGLFQQLPQFHVSVLVDDFVVRAKRQIF
jgi:hypothetical protein